ncbi:MAG: hypothetical protein LBE37_07440, partial [Sphingobacterium sp.]|nr:hypothetical protein [Sphingobacterium sp.]
LMAILVFGGCSKDLGSYDYKEINEIAFGGIATSYTSTYEEVLKIEPELNFTKSGETPERYSYEWKLVKSIPTTDADWAGVIVGRARALDYFVSAYPGSYSLYYKVTDKETDVTWSTRTSLTVTTQTATGFLLIGEDEEGYAAVEMVVMRSGADTVILKGLIADKGLPKFKGAVNIFHTGGSSRPSEAKLWVAGTEAGYYVNTSTFESSERNVFARLMFSSYSFPSTIFPVDYAPKVAATNGSVIGSQRVILTNTGDLFTAGIISGDIYGNPVNRLSVVDGDPLIKLAPYIMHGGNSGLSGYVVFDKDSNRFLRTSSSSATNLTVMADGKDDLFPWNQPEGRRLIYAENTKNTDGGASTGNVFALMKDAAGHHYIYKFSAYGAPSKKNGYTIPDRFNAALGQSRLFAFASTRTAMYFAIGSVLYAYDYNSGNERIITIKDFGEEITMLHADIQASATSLDLYVATYSPQTQGTIRKMILQNNTNTIELKEDTGTVWSGLSRIRKMNWRNTTH